jgi:dihydrodipicolinate synthase/N-acetylneuraminate lyase
MSERPSGTWGTVLVPWDDDDRIDERRLHAQLDVLTTAGLAGIYAHGTAGEFHELDEDEWELVTEILVGRCRDAGVGVQIGAGHMSARLSARRVARTVRYRPDAIQVILPDWLPLTTRDAVTAVDRLANAAGGIPIVLYNPPHAKTVLGPEALDELSSAVPSLVAVKVGGGNAEWYAAMRPAMRRLAVFVPGHTLATGHRLGAAGSFSNVACLSPVGSVAWQSMMDTDPPGAADLERRIQTAYPELPGDVRDAVRRRRASESGAGQDVGVHRGLVRGGHPDPRTMAIGAGGRGGAAAPDRPGHAARALRASLTPLRSSARPAMPTARPDGTPHRPRGR